MRCEVLAPEQDEGLSGCDQEVAAVGIRRLHHLEQLDTVAELPRPRQSVPGLDEAPDPLVLTCSLGTHVCITPIFISPPLGEVCPSASSHFPGL